MGTSRAVRGPVAVRRAVAGTLAALFLAAGPQPARAVMGGRDAPADGLARASVMVLSSRGGVCSGIVLAPQLILTAGHCAAGSAEHRVHFRGESGEPVLLALAGSAVHPGYDAGAVAGRRRSIDLALLRVAEPLPQRFTAAALAATAPHAGAVLTLGGYGLARPGDPRSSGTFRTASLPVIEPYGQSRILVWLKEAGGAAGACEGDSGGPIAEGAQVVAVTSWASGAKGCGGISQGVLVGPQRAWIDRIAAGWGAAVRWE
ncbi:trypsin-like serine protease [Methylobacterium sp. ID0610]|uniref:trypsin-like serine protease n=1 Tax=Methylobacterium carpenticola TaxID=3344827 RepID=UPI0036877EAA